MSNSLSRMFEWPPPFPGESPDADTDASRGERLVTHLRAQIARQKAVAKSLAESPLEGIDLVRAEIERQTRDLEAGIGRRESDPNAARPTSPDDRMAGLLDVVGPRGCAHLDELRWQMAQQAETLDPVLSRLKSKRSEQTHELVRQGIRHYINNEFSEAEERLLKALDADTTDYQVLMNLAFIALHREDGDGAVKYFTKAINLPEKLENSARVRAMRNLARAHYAMGAADKAVTVARDAAEMSAAAADHFAVALYAARAGDRDLALQRIDAAVEADASFCARALVEPDLAPMADDVADLLRTIATSRHDAVKETIDGYLARLVALEPAAAPPKEGARDGETVSGEVEAAAARAGRSEYLSTRAIALARYLERTAASLTDYTSCLEAQHLMPGIGDGITVLEEMAPKLSQVLQMETQLSKLERERKRLKDKTENARIRPSAAVPGVILILYAVPVGFAMVDALADKSDSVIARAVAGPIGALVWPVLWVMNRAEPGVNELFLRALTVAALLAIPWVAWCIVKKQRERRLRRIDEGFEIMSANVRKMNDGLSLQMSTVTRLVGFAVEYS